MSNQTDTETTVVDTGDINLDEVDVNNPEIDVTEADQNPAESVDTENPPTEANPKTAEPAGSNTGEVQDLRQERHQANQSKHDAAKILTTVEAAGELAHYAGEEAMLSAKVANNAAIKATNGSKILWAIFLTSLGPLVMVGMFLFTFYKVMDRTTPPLQQPAAQQQQEESVEEQKTADPVKTTEAEKEQQKSLAPGAIRLREDGKIDYMPEEDGGLNIERKGNQTIFHRSDGAKFIVEGDTISFVKGPNTPESQEEFTTKVKPTDQVGLIDEPADDTPSDKPTTMPVAQPAAEPTKTDEVVKPTDKPEAKGETKPDKVVEQKDQPKSEDKVEPAAK